MLSRTAFGNRECRDAQRSYADIVTKLATHSGVMPYCYEARDAQWSYADIATKLATYSGVTPIITI